MNRKGKLGKVILVGVILAITGGIVAIGLSMDDGKPKIQPLDPEKAETIRQVAQNRRTIARYQSLARAQYDVNEYVQTQFMPEWEVVAVLPKKERGPELKRLQDRARAEIQERRKTFDRAMLSCQSGGGAASLNTLRRTAEDNFDFGMRMGLIALAHRESSLRARKIRFNNEKDKMEPREREAVEKAIEKQEEACRKKKAELNLVRSNQSSVIALILRQAARQTD